MQVNALRRLAPFIAFVACVIPVTFVTWSTPASSAHDRSIMGPPTVTARQMAAWYDASGNTPDLPITVEALAQIFLEEGVAENVRGDVAFAQAIVETGWFSFSSRMPSSHHNYSGLGAVDGGSGSAKFPSPRIGVRAQIQHLRAYADETVTPDGFAYDLVDPRFDDLQGRYGSVRTWAGMGGGNWASDPAYGSKVLSLFADLVATETPGPESCAAAPAGAFADSPGGAAGSAIDCVAYLGIARGVEHQTYAPLAPVTRGQMATFIVRTGATMHAEWPAADDYFTDDDGRVHEESINRLAAAAIAAGTGPTTYDPLGQVTRGQMATFLIRTARMIGMTVPDEGWAVFTDLDKSVHRASIEIAARMGLASGMGDGTFRPDDAVSRGQIALFISRLLARAESAAS